MSVPTIVVAEMKAKPGREAELRERALELITPTRQEAGCLQYELHVSNSAGGDLLFYEIWTSQEALDAHLKTPHFTSFMTDAQDCLAQPPKVNTFRKIA